MTVETQEASEAIEASIDTTVASENTPTKAKGQYETGELLRFVRVRFPGNAKSFPFMIGTRYFQYGQKVIAPSDRGMALGYINSFPYDVAFKESMLPLKYINKIATEEDINEDQQNIDKQKEAEVICIELIERFKLDMNITHVEFTQFGKKAVIYFTAPNRVDFRALVKELVSKLKTRIELRQISGRDRAASIGGIGSCGRQLCCSSFLQKYGNATIKMAKNQSMMLVGSKINGVCGQLKCCIQYEDQVYSHKRQNLPKEGSIIKLTNGDVGKVLRLEILAENFSFLTDKGVKKRFAVDHYDHKNCKTSEGYEFPKRFDHISDETSTLVTNVKKQEIAPGQASMIKMLKGQAGELEQESEVPQPKKTPTNENDANRSKEKKTRHKNNRSNRSRSNRNRNKKPAETQGSKESGNKRTKGQNNRSAKSSHSQDTKPPAPKNNNSNNSFTYKRRKPE